jgi:NAD+ kinase
MKQARRINIVGNGQRESKRIEKKLRAQLPAGGFVPADGFDEDAELVVCIGGDGSLLNMLAEYDFPTMPVVGINTGHLGFFQEVDEKNIDAFIYHYKEGNYVVQTYKTVCAELIGAGGEAEKEPVRVKGLNEIVIRGSLSHSAHLNIFIGDSFIERFSGDGVLVATPAGSTAYNYSLGGSIVDPRLNLLQVTPIAAINSTAYRSFTSSILLPPDLSLGIYPEYPKSRALLVVADGTERMFSDIREIHVGFNPEDVTLLRFQDYDFWKKVKQKLL